MEDVQMCRLKERPYYAGYIIDGVEQDVIMLSLHTITTKKRIEDDEEILKKAFEQISSVRKRNAILSEMNSYWITITRIYGVSIITCALCVATPSIYPQN